MEDRPTQNQKEFTTNNGDKEKTPRSRVLSLLQQWREGFALNQEAREENTDENEREDDETDSLSPKKKRFFKRFRSSGFLREILSSSQPGDSERPPDAFVDLSPLIPPAHQENSIYDEEQQGRVGYREPRLDYENMNEPDLSDQEDMPPENLPAPNLIASESGEDNDEEAESPVLTSFAAPTQNISTVQTPAAIPSNSPSMVQNIPPSPNLPPVGPDNQMTGPNVPDMAARVNPEARDPRLGGAVAGLLAADVLNYAVARRRDSKNRMQNQNEHTALGAAQIKANREQEKLSDRVLAIEESRQNEARELSKVQKTNEQTVVIRRNSNKVEERTLKPQKNPETTVFSRDKQPNNVVEKSPMGFEKIGAIKGAETANKVPPSTFEAPNSVSSADKILQKVEKAAEEGIPIEALYELRHEVKDNENGGHGSGGIGQSALLQALKANVSDTSGLPARTLPPQQPITPPANNDTYRQAVGYGAGVALILIALLIIAVMLTGG